MKTFDEFLQDDITPEKLMVAWNEWETKLDDAEKDFHDQTERILDTAKEEIDHLKIQIHDYEGMMKVNGDIINRYIEKNKELDRVWRINCEAKELELEELKSNIKTLLESANNFYNYYSTIDDKFEELREKLKEN